MKPNYIRDAQLAWGLWIFTTIITILAFALVYSMLPK